MQPIIHKAAIALNLNPVSAGISPSDPTFLVLNLDMSVSVFVERPSRLPFGFGKSRLVLAGKLGARATDIVRPALERKADLRVRIIEVEPAHLSRSGRAAIFVSVWGNPADIAQPKSTPAIFTRSKINDPVPPRNE
ncbi:MULTISPECIES: hypothetical protein [Marivita]|uniref:Uncharacterized protein n=1 Tax=Marivita cryptomonadis TaxID=505252 RepID=A0A9Q2PG19_9RHOB|nr:MULTISPECIES: hypothetical protein [Marivita]MBM2324174.1 hypothetical protein [Marivita cryptomonadis]MBM2333764.1 hypothetical protein [Marivita cryptomonadis]MBM2343341.1 hypothetical protein [Marivita cryptomonadis]MBM2348013.1 hypothetical protein [Marivita cryptomonadis]MBM2352694.1 hypothetical protein [Marivita cryptomonadis]